jgi:N-methylhydantoinase A
VTSVDRAVGVSELESSESVTRMGIDIGGTFTDVAAVDGRGQLFIGKRLTSHGGEHEAVVAAIADSHVSLDEPQTIVAHATTLVINSLIERRGARVGLVTTRGFADVLDIRRGTRPEIFNLFYQRDDTLVPKALRMELYERVSASGDVELQPSDEKLAELADFLRRKKVEAIAIAFINAYVEPANERYVARYLREALPEVPVTLSSDLSREWREYERTSTVVANAYVIPVAKRYLRRLLRGLGDRGFTGDFVVLDSNGGALHVDTATALPIRTVESGPVAGVIGARALAARLSIPNVVTFDMGGTTAKTCLIEDGRYASTNLYFIGGYSRGFPLQVPTADVIEVGAGGGSIAWVDHGGRLRLVQGPRVRSRGRLATA